MSISSQQYNITTQSNQIYVSYDVQAVDTSGGVGSYTIPAMWLKCVRNGRALELVIMYDSSLSSYVAARYDNSGMVVDEVNTGTENSWAIGSGSWHKLEFWFDFGSPNRVGMKVDGSVAYSEIADGNTLFHSASGGDRIEIKSVKQSVGDVGWLQTDVYFKEICVNQSFEDDDTTHSDTGWLFIDPCDLDLTHYWSRYGGAARRSIFQNDNRYLIKVTSDQNHTVITHDLSQYDLSDVVAMSLDYYSPDDYPSEEDFASDHGHEGSISFGISSTNKGGDFVIRRSRTGSGDGIAYFNYGAERYFVNTPIPSNSWIRFTIIAKTSTDEIWIYKNGQLIDYRVNSLDWSHDADNLVIGYNSSFTPTLTGSGDLDSLGGRRFYVDNIKLGNILEVQP